MASRLLNQFAGSLEKGRVLLYCKATIGASGAPTVVSARSKGIRTLVRNSAGDYTLTLQDAYQALLGFQATFQSASGIPAATCVGVKSVSLSAASKTIGFVCSTAGGGSATDPGSGETLYLQVVLSNSTAV